MGHSLYPIRILIVNNVYLHLTHVFSFAASFYTPVCNACLLVKAHLLSVCNISLQLNIIMIAVHIQPPPPKRRRLAATVPFSGHSTEIPVGIKEVRHCCSTYVKSSQLY